MLQWSWKRSMGRFRIFQMGEGHQEIPSPRKLHENGYNIFPRDEDTPLFKSADDLTKLIWQIRWKFFKDPLPPFRHPVGTYEIWFCMPPPQIAVSYWIAHMVTDSRVFRPVRFEPLALAQMSETILTKLTHHLLRGWKFKILIVMLYWIQVNHAQFSLIN